ncbi:MAG TPA: GntR family transcriptional regulator [Gemmatimonadaceae bacterium]|nr:GntR family transcriptional regulator [Gemmatimonadaceae bacterium]
MASSKSGSAHRTPRYQRVADDLLKRIGSGKYPVGGYLPTEMALCGHYGISRHTVREALRQLRDAGLISRRRRVGTEVVARTPRASYTQPTKSIGDLLQYAEETRLSIVETKAVVCDAALAELLECREGARWLRVNSLRAVPGDARPVCLTTAYLDLRLPNLEQNLAELSGPIPTMLEKVYGIRTARIEQSIQAVKLGKRQAKLLRALDGGPALQAIRRYYDPSGRLIKLSNAIHPGERFTYVTSLVTS